MTEFDRTDTVQPTPNSEQTPNRGVYEYDETAIAVASGVRAVLAHGNVEFRIEEEPRRGRPEIRFGLDEHGQMWLLHFAGRNLTVRVIRPTHT